MIHQQIYQAFLDRCPQYEMAGPWGRFQSAVDIRESPSNTLGVMDSLQEDYADEDLLASRLAVMGSKGWLIFDPSLTEPFSAIVPLCAQPGDPPFDLLTKSGTLSRRLPVSPRSMMVLSRQRSRRRVCSLSCRTWKIWPRPVARHPRHYRGRVDSPGR